MLRLNKKSQRLTLENTSAYLSLFCFSVTMRALQFPISNISILFITNAFTAPLVGHSTIRLRDSDTSCAPVSNSNLAPFNLQLPTGSSGKVDQILQLFPHFLFWCAGHESAFSIAMPDYTEQQALPHGTTRVSPRSWNPGNDVSSFRVELAVLWLDDSKYGMVIGQVEFGDNLSKKPVAKLFYNRVRVFTVGVSQIPDVGSLKMTEVGQIEVGKRDTT
jgi:hypothetical protein